MRSLIEITAEGALSIIEDGIEIQCLINGNTESIAKTKEDIINHAQIGAFGVEVEGLSAE